MRNLGIFCVAGSLASLAYVLWHFALLPTVHPVGREAIWTRSCAVGFVIFGLNGAVILRRVRRFKRLR